MSKEIKVISKELIGKKVKFLMPWSSIKKGEVKTITDFRYGSAKTVCQLQFDDGKGFNCSFYTDNHYGSYSNTVLELFEPNQIEEIINLLNKLEENGKFSRNNTYFKG